MRWVGQRLGEGWRGSILVKQQGGYEELSQAAGRAGRWNKRDREQSHRVGTQ